MSGGLRLTQYGTSTELKIIKVMCGVSKSDEPTLDVDDDAMCNCMPGCVLMLSSWVEN